MKETLHYLLMADHSMLQKALIASIKDTGLTSGQPKVLDYLLEHDGAVQKDIAAACHIEPASLTSILNGMESKHLIERKLQNGNRRSSYVFLTKTGREYAKRLEKEFSEIEEKALDGFETEEKEHICELLSRLCENMKSHIFKEAGK